MNIIYDPPRWRVINYNYSLRHFKIFTAIYTRLLPTNERSINRNPGYYPGITGTKTKTKSTDERATPALTRLHDGPC